MLSVVIPARNEQFLQKTIDNLLEHAEGEIEVIAVLDGYWPDPALRDDPRLKIIHRGVSHGMRQAINAGVALAKGEYILKIDAHCMVGQGFDKILIADCQDNWVMVPRRKRLDAENWCVQDCGKPDVDYMFLSAPTDPNDFGGAGLHGKIWDEKNKDPELKKVEIDDLMSFQGSAWFMKKSYFYELELMDEETYGGFAQEAPEIGLKCWLSGGRVVVTKRTWYAHLHKGKKYGRGYRLSNDALIHGNKGTNRFITGKAWHKQIHDLKWLVDKFSPCPTWEGYEWGSFEKNDTKEIPTRNDLAKLFGKRGFKRGAEIGVEKGKYSEVLLKAVPGLFLTLVDPLGRFPGYREHVTQEELDSFVGEIERRTSGYDVNFIRKTSMEALSLIPDESLDFVYIDARHEYQYVKEDIEGWYKKVRVGGIVSGHDYVEREGFGVIQAVSEFVNENDIDEYFLTEEDKSPSWYFVKE
jgi:glycosyltransferase involved in cell wall biosynthesis